MTVQADAPSGAPQAAGNGSPGLRHDPAHGRLVPGPAERRRLARPARHLRGLQRIALGADLRGGLRGRRLPVAVLPAVHLGVGLSGMALARDRDPVDPARVPHDLLRTSDAPTTARSSPTRQPAPLASRSPSPVPDGGGIAVHPPEPPPLLPVRSRSCRWSSTGSRRRSFAFRRAAWRIGLGSVILLADSLLLTGYSFSCHSLRHIVGGRIDCFSCSAVEPDPTRRLAEAQRAQARHMAWAWTSLVSRGARRPVHPAAGDRCVDRPRDPFLGGIAVAIGPGALDAIESHPVDVLVIGAGGRRAARGDRGGGGGLQVGLVCKSLLGKAHTVMAEGGVAAAMGTSRRRTAGRSTSATRWRAASCSTTGAWPSSTPRRRPTGCASSRRGARCSTARRRPHPPAAVRRPHVSAARPRRRPHRPRDDPDPPGPRGRRPASTSTWSAPSPDLDDRAAGVAGALGYWRDDRRSSSSRPRPSCSRPAASARRTTVTSNSWECTGDGQALAY